MKRIFGVFMLFLLSAAACSGDKTAKVGFIDKQRKMVINPQFDYASGFADGLAQVRIGDDKTGKYGFIDKQGKMVINPQFDYASGFADGLASVRIGDSKTGKYGFISR